MWSDMNKKKTKVVYEFADFHPKKHHYRRYVIAKMSGDVRPVMYFITPQVFKTYKRNYKVKIKKVV